MEQKTPGRARRIVGRWVPAVARKSRRLAGLVLFIGWAVSGIGFPGVPTAAAQTNTVAVVGADRLALRRGPGKQFPPFDSLKAGSRVEIEEIEGEWARVITPGGQRGYVHSNFLQIPGEPRPAAAATVDSPRPAPTATAARPTERKRPPTSSPTRTPRKRATPTPSSTVTRQPDPALATATAIGDRNRQLTDELSALSARNAGLEKDLRVALDALAATRAGGATVATPAAGDVSAELTRLTAAVDDLQKQLKDRAGRASPGASATAADARQGLSGATVGAGVLGIAVGWLLGTLLGRRTDRSRRARIRF